MHNAIKIMSKLLRSAVEISHLQQLQASLVVTVAGDNKQTQMQELIF